MKSFNSRDANDQRPRLSPSFWKLGPWELGVFERLLIVLVSALIGAVVISAQQAAPGQFTAAQATQGRDVYLASCAGCHAENLGGREAPALTGVSFQQKWRAVPAQDLLNYIQQNMPLTGPPLQPAQYAAVTAFILQS